MASTSRDQVSAIARRSIIDAARAEGDDNTLWVTAQSMCSSINRRFLTSTRSGGEFEIDLHDLWHTYYVAAKHIDSQHPAQNRLALQLLKAHRQGRLQRRHTNRDGVETARTIDGEIWNDLPFLIPDMISFWTEDCATMSASQRLNFATFLANLASVGLQNDRFSGVGLIVLRQTLETSRHLGVLVEERTAEGPFHPSNDLTIAELLPAANAWLFHAGGKFVELSDVSWNDCPQETGGVGDLILGDPTVSGVAAGFSSVRWMFWLRRVGEIADEARYAGASSLETFARRTMDNMLVSLHERHTSVPEASAIAGRHAQQRPQMQLLGATHHVA